MEVNKNMQQMPMDNMHNMFWRDDQVTVLFQSDQPLIIDGGLNPQPPPFFLEQYREKLTRFLRSQGVPVTLNFLGESDNPPPDQSTPPLPVHSGDRLEFADDLQLPPGIYPFGFRKPIKSDSPFGNISTSVITLFEIVPDSSQGGSNTSMEMPVSGGDGSVDKCIDPTGNLVSLIVRTINKKLDVLSRGIYRIPITIATPVWLSGGTPIDVPQGCPLTPPIPVDDACSNWHFRLRDLPNDLRSKKGKDVTVFILDAFPERGVIARAAQDAGDDNRLLRKVNEKVTFDYSLMSGVQAVQKMADTKSGFVGKDVYGRHYPILLADHGLFIAGIIHDIARQASIECIRILDDLCVGDLDKFANALWRIYRRKALRSGDLYGKAVVINMSLVMPTDDEACSLGVDSTVGGINNIWSSIRQPLLGLVELGVIITASAGNEGDLREFPGMDRPPALYPAAFAYPPYSVDGIIPVGAVDKNGNAASYSCYPGPLGVATYGGEVPGVTPPDPPSSNPTLGSLDALRGIYSSVEFPPLSADPPEQYYTAPNDHAWAYWMGTSFATPIISALAARVLEGSVTGSALQEILNAATGRTLWDRLDPTILGSKTAQGNMLKAEQHCIARDHDDDEEEE